MYLQFLQETLRVGPDPGANPLFWLLSQPKLGEAP
jgi:hypothetical protein